MADISITARSGGATSNVVGESASLHSPSIIKLKINPQDIASLDRSGNDLIITLNTGEKITVDNFFVVDAQGHGNELVLEDEHGALWWVKEPQAGLHFEPLADIDALMLESTSHESATPWVLGALGIAAIGGGIAVAASGGGGGHHNNDSDNGSHPGGPDGDADADSDADSDSDSDGGSKSLEGVASLVITDNVQDFTGSIARGGITNDSAPVFSGTALANSTVSIYDGKTLLGSVHVDGTGHWSFKPLNPLSDGVHSFTTIVTMGNLSSPPSGAFIVTVDTVAPGPITMIIATDNHAPIVGTIAAGSTINDSTPVLSGKAEPGSTVNIYDGSVLVGTTITDSHGNWGLELTTVLGDGPHSLTARAIDAAGNAGPATDPIDFIVDTGAPPQMTNFEVTDDVGASKGELHSGDDTDDSTPTFSGGAGSAEGGATVSIYDGSILLGKVTAAADGSWTFTPGAPLASGSHTFTTVVTDAAGNASQPSDGFELIITPPVNTITSVEANDDVAPVTGPLANGAYTNDNLPDFSGTAPPLSIITVYIDGIPQTDLILTDPLGHWTFTPSSALDDGQHTFAFSADNGATQTEPFVLNIDTHAPDAAGGITVVDDKAPDIGQLHSGDVTNDQTPVISGTAEVGATVTIYDGSSVIGTALVGDDGHWGFIPDTPLTDGTHHITTTVTDAAGNVGSSSPDFVLVVDTVAPDPVTLFIATDNVNPIVGSILAGDVTNDSTPILSGKAEPGSEIIIYDAGKVIARTVTDSKGNWGLELTTPLSDGLHGLTAVAVDAAGNASTPTPELVFSVDTVAPISAYSILVTDNVGPVQGNLKNGGTTDDTTPSFSGRAEVGATVSIYDGATLLGTASVGANGAWSFTPGAPLTNGLHHFTTVVTDAAGNASDPSPSFNLTISTVAGPISNLVVIDDVAPGLGVLTNGEQTNDSKPTFSGSAAANSTLSIYDNGVFVTTVPVDSAGHWSYTPSSALSDGSHSITFTVDNGSGPSTPSEPFVVVVDTVAPNPVGNLTVVDDKAPGIGQLTNGSLTNDNTPIISGTAEPGSTVTLYDGAAVIGIVTVGSDGQWGIIPNTPLADGVHHLTTTVTDGAGNVSATSPDFVLGVDTTPPNPVTMFIATDNKQPVVGTIESGESTNDNTPILSGKGDPGAQVIIYDGTTEIARTTVDTHGNWGVELSAPLADGSHSLTAVAVDAAGNTSAPTSALDIVVDTVPPAAITDLTVTDDVGAQQGLLLNGAITDDATPTFSGSAEGGTTVSIYDNGELLGTALVAGNGSWTFTPDAPLSSGAHSFTATVTDDAGNVSSATPPFILDITPPQASVTVTLVLDDVSPVTGIVQNGGTTNDNQPSFFGTSVGATIGSTVSVYDNGVLVGTVVVNIPGGFWNWQSGGPLAEGDHSFTFELNTFGTTTPPSPPFILHVDTVVPDPISGLTIVDDQSPGIGQLANGDSTNDGTPIISGNAEPGATVSIYDNGVIIGSTTVGADGQWGFIPSTPLLDGSHNIQATVTDAAGNVSALSPNFILEVDTGIPGMATGLQVYDNQQPVTGYVTAGGATNDNTPTISGQAELNATVTIYDGTTVLGTAQVDGSGNWSFTPTLPLGDGQHSLTTTVTDAAGNISPSSPAFVLNVDTVPPAQITSFNITADSGVVAPGGSTNDTTLTASGKAEPNSVVTIYDTDGTTVLGSIQADSNGDWSIGLAALGAGSHTLTAVATDDAGNVSVVSPPEVVVIDLTPPAQIAGITVTDNHLPVLGVVAANGDTNDKQPILSGHAEPNSIVNIYNGSSTPIATVQTDANGNWSVQPTTPLQDGQYNLTATATDAAGNVSIVSPTFTFNVDTLPPGQMQGLLISAHGVGLSNGASTNVAAPVISGVSEEGATIIVYDTNGTTVLGTTIAGTGGVWSINLPTLSQGSHSLTATATDVAGNVSVISTPTTVVIDTVAPTQITGITVTDNVLPGTGTVTSGKDINDPSPVLSGTAEKNSIINVYNGSTLIGTGQADGSGSWSFKPTIPLPDGNYSLTATATDAAGNTSIPSPSFSFTVDTVPPAVITSLIVTDDVAPYIGPVSNGGSTNDTTPTFSGKVEAGATITLYSGTDVLGTTTAGPDGSWSFTPSPLTEGTYHITATVTDLAGNVSNASADFVLTVDKTAPTQAPTFTVTDNVLPVIGSVSSGGSTNDPTPTFSGVAAPGSTVTIYNGATVIGTANASNTDGSWSFTPTTSLGDGEYNLTATATDAAGNVGPASSSFTLTIDTVAPTGVTNLTVTDDVAPVTGLLTSGASTNDLTPTFSGKAEAGTTVNFYTYDAVNDVTVLLGTTPVDSNGNWTFTPTLTNGNYSITTTVTDAAGNTSAPSSPAFTLTVDNVAPSQVLTFVVTDNVLPETGSVANGGATNDTAPIISGTAENNSSVILFDNGVWIATVTASASGAWSYTPPAPLAQGSHSFTTIVEDAAGNQSGVSPEYVITVDSIAPNAVTELVVNDSVSPVTGALANGASTNDTLPTFSGKAEVGTTVALYEGATKLGEVQVGASGQWSLDPTTPLTPGSHTITVVVTDAAGNVSTGNPSFTLDVDVDKPDPVSTITATDDVNPVTGPIANNGYTNDTTPTFSGTAEKGSTVTVYDGATPLGTVIASAVDGSWSFTPSAPLGQGSHTITATATDAAGNIGNASPDFVLTVDSIAPNPVTNVTVTDNVPGGTVGALASGGVTNDKNPVISGTAEVGSTVAVYANGAYLGSVNVTATDGSWSYTSSTLTDATYSITTTVTDQAGNVSGSSTPFTITVDTTPPATPGTITASDNVPLYEGTIPTTGINSGLTNDNTPTLSGVVEANATVNIYQDDTFLASVTANASGQWSYTTSTLEDGDYTFNVTATDKAGNVSDHSADLVLHIDATAPANVLSLAIDGNLGIPALPLVNNQPVFTGVAENGATVSIYEGTTLIGSVVVNNVLGSWTYTPTAPLADGSHTFSVIVTDAAGNQSGPVASATISIDTSSLTGGIGNLTVMDDVTPVTGVIANGGVTNDSQPEFSGTGRPGTTITFYDNGNILFPLGSTVVGIDGNWTFTPDAAHALSDGSHIITTLVTGESGLPTVPATLIQFSVDTAAPDNVTGLVVTDDVAPGLGQIANGSTTNDKTPTFSGTAGGPLAELGSTVIITEGATVIGQATIGATGLWTITPTTPLGEGPHNFVITVVDQAGNASTGTNFSLTVDTTPPAQITAFTVSDDVSPITGAIAANGYTNDTTPVLTGGLNSAEAGSTIRVYDGAILLGSTVANADGSWTFNSPALLNGSHSLTITATDAAGNVSTASPAFNFTVDTIAPAPIVALTVSNNVGSTALATGSITNDNTPVISGRAEAGSTVSVYNNGSTLVGTALVAADGTWTVTPSSLADGTYVLTATATDVAGNTSLVSPSFTLNIDTTPPGIPGALTLTDNVAPVTGNVTQGGTINDTRPVISGAAGSVEANSLVTVYDGNTVLGTTRALADGSWVFTPLTALSNSQHTLTITATDAAGNVSDHSPAFTITVDNVAPVAPGAITVSDDVGPIVGNVTNGGVTDDTLPTLSGTVEPGATVKLYDNGVLIATFGSDGTTGKWNYQTLTALPEGVHSFTVTATDAAGNVSLPSPIFAVTVDTTAPAPILTYTVTDDVSPVIGTLVTGSSTNDNQPTISGLGATPNSIVIILDGGIEIGRTNVNGLGGWSFTPTTPLPDGPHSLTLVVSDTAGNMSSPTTPFTLTVDTQTPTAGALPLVNDNVGAVQGDLPNNALSDDNTPTLHGTVEPLAFVNIYDGSKLLATVQADGSGVWTFTTPVLADGAHHFSTTVSDAAGNVSGSSPIFNLTIDTTPPPLALNITVTDDVLPVTGVLISGSSTNDNTPTINGTAEVGATVTIYNGAAILGTALVGANGSWTFTPTALPDGTYTLSTTVTDPAGNVSGHSPDFVLTVDTALPAQVSTLTVTDSVNPVTGTVNSNGFSNDNRPVISGTAEGNATITVYDGTKVLGTTTANASGVWTFRPSTTLADGVHSFTATATDAAGNVGSASPTFTLNVDTVAPGLITGLSVYDDVAPDLGYLTSGNITNDTKPTFSGVAEAGSTVNIYDGTTVIGTATAGANGSWTWTPTNALSTGLHSFTFTATDAAGNEGLKTPVFTLTIDPTIGTQILNAVNDEAGLSLTTSIQQVSNPSSSTQNLNVLKLGVGDLLSLSVIQSNNLPTFHVDDGASRALTLQASAVGVTLLSTFDLYVYKSNGDGTYSMYQKVDNFLTVLLLAGTTGKTSLNLPSGDYVLLLQADDGLSVLTSSKLTIASDVTTGVFVDTAGGVTTGNVMTGVGGGGVDSTPAGTVVSGASAASASGLTTVAASGNTTIVGTYGTLTINAQGAYTYTLKSGVSPSSITGPDVFTYQIKAPNGSTSNATLTIDLNLSSLHANSDLVTLTVDPTPVDVSTASVSNTSLILANVSLGSVLSTSVSTNGQLQIDVGANATRDITISGSTLGLALGSHYDLYIYKLNPSTGSYEQYQQISSWIQASLLGASASKNFTLGTGHYVFLLKVEGALGLVTLATLTTSNDVTHTQQAAVESVNGNVITGAGNTSGGVDVAPAGTVVSNVNGQAIAATGNTTIVGNYGTLVINAQGAYTYTLKTGMPATSLGQETFTYVIRNGSSVSTATLTISLPSVGTLAATQSIMTTDALLTTDTSTAQDAAIVQTTASAATLLASTSETTAADTQQTTSTDSSTQGATVQVVNADTMTHAALVLEFATLPTANGNVNYQILDSHGTVVYSGTLSTDTASLTAKVELDGAALNNGQYSVVLHDSAGNVLDTAFSSVLTSIAVTPQAAADGVTAEGQIAETAHGEVWASITLSNESGQQITEIAGGQSQTLAGLYGTLTMHADGSYTYSLNSGVSVSDLTQLEQFEYTLKAPDGTLSSGNLIIDLHPQVEGSDKADTTVGSAYDTTYTLGGGADTVIFNLLDSNDATGGNGHNNHWTDFSVSDGDHIDISNLLTDWSGKSEDLGQYLSIEYTASGDTIVSIDRDGEGSKYQPTQLITLDGVQPTLEELLHHDTTANHG